MVEKYVKDGKVAILYHRPYGLGWSTDNGVPELAYDKRIVERFLDGDLTSGAGWKKFCELLGYKNVYGRPTDISWVEQGTPYYIACYDGSESVITVDRMSIA